MKSNCGTWWSISLALVLGWVMPVLRAQTLAQFHTPLGDLLVQLYDQDKPLTVSNFVRYVKTGRFDNTFVQRWQPGFVIQGGGYLVTNRTTNPSIDVVQTFDPILNEFSVGRRFSNVFGTIAMARVSGQTNSATSQWFFNLANNTSLDSVDGGFTVFGAVQAGTNLLNRFNSTSTNNGIYIANLPPVLPTLPVLSTNATYNDLIYTEITLPAWPKLSVQLLTNGTCEIRWNSLSNFVNTVQFTTNWPPVWQPLVQTNGTGGLMSVRDSTVGDRLHLYRVRVP